MTRMDSTENHGEKRQMTNIDSEIKNRYLRFMTHRCFSHWLIYFFAWLCFMFLAQIENHMGFYTWSSTPIHYRNNPSLQRSNDWVSLIMVWESLDKKMNLAHVIYMTEITQVCRDRLAATLHSRDGRVQTKK